MNEAIENKMKWNFDNSYARLPKVFYASQKPTPVENPKMVIFNSDLARELGLDAEMLITSKGTEIFSGNRLPDGSMPIAQAYAGHQFGYFTMLGDGRAILIGEQITPKKERYDIQLKGSGKTPFSRGGDGRAALGPMLREYIISEAMHALGIATTRSLAIVTTGENVYRETILPGAILTRVASSHIRVGTFEYISRYGSFNELKALADYTLNRHFSEYLNVENPYIFLLEEVIRRQAKLIAKWQHIGFVHGVMNTDNMTLSGETIDYGPCAFIDNYNPETVFSSIDLHGRYAFGNQPNIAAWNLARFAETLIPLLDTNETYALTLAQEKVSRFHSLYEKHWYSGMKSKLGMTADEPGDVELINKILDLMNNYNADYTNTFLKLTFDNREENDFFKTSDFVEWYRKWKERLVREDEERSFCLMKNSNPALIPRNHRVEEALEAAVTHGDYSVMERLLTVLSNPFAHTKDQSEYAVPPPPSACKYKTFCGT